ncbi:MAG: ribonuclease III [Bacillota bacterium]
MKSIEEKIGYSFKDRRLLETALTHSSYARERGGSDFNERMEFLGDAMLDAIAGEELYREFPEREEGFLSRTRAALVCEKFLFEVAQNLSLGDHLLVSAGEEKMGGRERPSILADAVEALIGAVFLDGGYEEARKVVLGLLEDGFSQVRKGRALTTDFKTTLQEQLQAEGIAAEKIQYVDSGESGPDHDKRFTVKLIINGREEAEGEGKSKKQAQQRAAEKALSRRRNAF